jgi:hypothetical protein
MWLADKGSINKTKPEKRFESGYEAAALELEYLGVNTAAVKTKDARQGQRIVTVCFRHGAWLGNNQFREARPEGDQLRMENGRFSGLGKHWKRQMSLSRQRRERKVARPLQLEENTQCKQ